MRKILSKIILFFLGWEVMGIKKFPKRCVVVAAPHTSNWDFFIGMCYGYILGVEFRYLIKSEFFIPILGTLFRYNGGIPVYRDSNYNLVEQLSNMFNKSEELILVITPEGTRSRVEKWKTGFYHIANNANIPILLLALDFGKKKIGIINEITCTGDIKRDIGFIEHQFKGIKGKIPANYNNIIQ
tara:strand:- start:494 stop:1045 length:552 start_codon:yes stop_codon:yes gene_type:complete